MANFVLRISNTLAEDLTKAAEGAGMSRNSYIEDLLQRHINAYPPEEVMAWFKADKIGDGLSTDCQLCGKRADGEDAWFALVANRLEGPYCAECAKKP